MATLAETARELFRRALADCSIEQAMARRVSVRDGVLFIDGEAIPLANRKHLYIFSVGKAATAMLPALTRLLPRVPGCDVGGILIAPERPSNLPSGFRYFAGGHPVPNEASFAGGRAALEMAHEAAMAADRSLCLFLISGGSSAMMELPLDPKISREDTAGFYRAMVGSGASIVEINCVRKHFSAVKGGRLAVAAGGADFYSLLVSDVPAGCEDALGSGPTLPDASTVAECRKILARYKLLEQFPASVRNFFQSDTLPETPKPRQLDRRASVLLSARDLAEAAASRARSQGWAVAIDNSCDEWDYRAAAAHLIGVLRELRGRHERVCLLSAGEVTVALPRKPGVGGRNQQFALYAATLLTPEDGEVAILSAGSDGIDGNSPAAGAALDNGMLAGPEKGPGKMEAARLALEKFDAYPLLEELGAGILSGPSGNNLRDLRILLARGRVVSQSPEFHKS